jgi:hypothetical protein
MFAPTDEVFDRVVQASSLAAPPGALEELLWKMSLEELAFFANGDTEKSPAREASRILDVRVQVETAEQIRRTNLLLVVATWALVAATIFLAFSE